MKLAIFICKLAANVNQHGHILVNFYILSVEGNLIHLQAVKIFSFKCDTFLNFLDESIFESSEVLLRTEVLLRPA